MQRHPTREKLFADLRAFWKDLAEAHFTLDEDTGAIRIPSATWSKKWYSLVLFFKQQLAQATQDEQAEFRSVSSDVAQAVFERVQASHSNALAQKAAAFIEAQLHN